MSTQKTHVLIRLKNIDTLAHSCRMLKATFKLKCVGSGGIQKDNKREQKRLILIKSKILLW